MWPFPPAQPDPPPGPSNLCEICERTWDVWYERQGRGIYLCVECKAEAEELERDHGQDFPPGTPKKGR